MQEILLQGCGLQLHAWLQSGLGGCSDATCQHRADVMHHVYEMMAA